MAHTNDAGGRGRHAHENQVLQVIVLASHVFDIPHHWITGRDRRARPFEARAAAMAVARKLTGASYPALGEIFGRREHTTVMNAVGQVPVLRIRSPRFDRRFVKLQELAKAVADRPGILDDGCAGVDAFNDLVLALLRARNLDASRTAVIVQAFMPDQLATGDTP